MGGARGNVKWGAGIVWCRWLIIWRARLGARPDREHYIRQLLGDRLDNLPEALALARRTLSKVRQNLVWAFGYNLIALPVAAGVLLPGQGLLLSPPLAALLMALSSITVVLNALALRIR